MAIQPRIDAVIDRALSNRMIVGTVVLVSEDGAPVYARAAGYADREAKKSVEPDTIFRFASVTKPIVAATALAMVERGLLSLDDPVAKHLPYFTPRTDDGSTPAILVRHLLTHTAGLAYAYPADPTITTGLQNTDLDHDQNLSRIARQPLSFAPGERWQYSVATDVLGAVIVRVSGETLEHAVETYVVGPLGMKDTAFHIVDRERLATPYGDAESEPERMGDPHSVYDKAGKRTLSFSPGRIFNPRAFQSGGAGAAGTASDVLTFLEAIRRGGGAILKPETVGAGFANQIGDAPMRPDDFGVRFGFFGAVLIDPAAAQSPCAAGTTNWGGVYGHAWYVDRRSKLTIVVFSNTAVEGCTGRYPKDIRDAVYG